MEPSRRNRPTHGFSGRRVATSCFKTAVLAFCLTGCQGQGDESETENASVRDETESDASSTSETSTKVEEAPEVDCDRLLTAQDIQEICGATTTLSVGLLQEIGSAVCDREAEGYDEGFGYAITNFFNEADAAKVAKLDGGLGPTYEDYESELLTNYYKSLASVGQLVIKATTQDSETAICKPQALPIIVERIKSRM